MKCSLQKAALTFLMFVFTVAIYSQEQRTCGTDVYMQEKMQDPSFAKKQKSRNKKFKEELARVKSGASQAKMATLMIPVAVHFPEGNEAQRPCLEALAQSQVDVLNQDYTATNADIANWAAASGFYPGTTTGAFDVEFVIATRNHPANTDDDLVEGGPAVSIGYNFGNGGDQDIKWAGYKNFLVKTIAGGILGYSPLGGSIANGAAVVMNPAAFGSDAIAPGCASNGVNFIPGAPYNLGRTVTHELGHYFTLNHTFDGGCAGNNDGINDTPAITGANYGCPGAGTIDGCVAGEKALTMNYMDYTNDACMYMLSQGQVDAMTAYWNVTAGDLLTNVITTDYSLNFASDELNVCEGNPVVYTFDYDADDSFSTQVDFTYTVNPAGPTVTFSQQNSTVDTNGITATVTGATAGNYTVTVTGTYGTEVQNYNLALNVFNATLVSPNLTAPVNNATDVVPTTTLMWGAQTNVQNYTVAVYTDPGLTTPYQAPVTVTGTSYVLSGLNSLTSYWWTVTANNLCSSGPVSSANTFTTANVNCGSDTNSTDVPVPDGTGTNATGPAEGAAGVSIISVANGVSITDVNVTLSITHGYVEDLRVVLTSPTGTDVELFANLSGNDGVNFVNTVFDDEAGSIITGVVPGDAPFTATYMPENALSGFDGEVSLGDWTLSVYDFWTADAGTINSWSLELCGSPLPDADNDGIPDVTDNCVNTANADQADWNNNGVGDVCDDTDNDGVFDDVDNCVTTANPGQEDMENDGVGDACQVYDADADGILDDVDNCPTTPNPGQEDVDGNGIGDACQDTDSDGILDINDNCPLVANSGQEDADGNGIGDACQDTDSDGVLDIDDNCPLTSNSDQADDNNDGIGDVCESVEPTDTLTPNGDLQNDTWNIKNIENVSNTVKVFNRHGVKVFDASNYVNNTWGGESTEGGSGLLPAGSYYYVIEYTSTQGEGKTVKGWMYINY